eukprot:TRINITY_DN7797_c0_g1_i9.p2 TRINITY_DN7797_c0_g1~~TRINITY_DN7797_c0_g1_i9.p2  ORF type:complete len:104 (-),score=22.09 TRINITY_DN7797_c0_g1_i9:274-585(-)
MFDDNSYGFIALTSAQFPSNVLTTTLADAEERFYEANPEAKEMRVLPESVNKEFLEELAKECANRLEYQNNPSYELQVKIKDSLKASIEGSNIAALRVSGVDM